MEGRRPDRRSGLRLLRTGDQHQRGAPGGRAAVGGVPLQPGPPTVARTAGSGLRPAGRADRHAVERYGRRDGAGHRCRPVTDANPFNPTQDQVTAAKDTSPRTGQRRSRSGRHASTTQEPRSTRQSMAAGPGQPGPAAGFRADRRELAWTRAVLRLHSDVLPAADRLHPLQRVPEEDDVCLDGARPGRPSSSCTPHDELRRQQHRRLAQGVYRTSLVNSCSCRPSWRSSARSSASCWRTRS